MLEPRLIKYMTEEELQQFVRDMDEIFLARPRKFLRDILVRRFGPEPFFESLVLAMDDLARIDMLWERAFEFNSWDDAIFARVPR